MCNLNTFSAAHLDPEDGLWDFSPHHRQYDPLPERRTQKRRIKEISAILGFRITADLGRIQSDTNTAFQEISDRQDSDAIEYHGKGKMSRVFSLWRNGPTRA